MKKRKRWGVYIEHDLLWSEAFLSLSKNGIKVLLAMLSERRMVRLKKSKDYTWVNWKDMVFTYQMAKEHLHLRSDSFNKALRELYEKGFLDVEHWGGAYKKDPTLYRLLVRHDSTPQVIERWRHYGTPQCNPTTPWPTDCRKGRGWDVYQKKRKEKGKSKPRLIRRKKH